MDMCIHTYTYSNHTIWICAYHTYTYSNHTIWICAYIHPCTQPPLAPIANFTNDNKPFNSQHAQGIELVSIVCIYFPKLVQSTVSTDLHLLHMHYVDSSHSLTYQYTLEQPSLDTLTMIYQIHTHLDTLQVVYILVLYATQYLSSPAVDQQLQEVGSIPALDHLACW